MARKSTQQSVRSASRIQNIAPAIPPRDPVSASQYLQRIRLDWIAALISLLVLTWVITRGDWNLVPQGGRLETFFDAQAESLLQGRIDVPREAIAWEAFIRDGKSYGYFGPTPALFRLPLEILFPSMHGRWSCLSMLLASVLMVGVLLLFFERLDSRFAPVGGQKLKTLLRAVLILGATLGSTTVFVSTEKRVYQETIIWGSSLTLAHAVFLTFYLMNPRSKWLVLSCITAFLAFFARVSVGAGALFSLFLLDAALLLSTKGFGRFLLGKVPPRSAAIPISVTLVISALLWCGLNYWKFGQVFTSQPIALHVLYDRERLNRMKGDLFSLYNLPITVTDYLSPTGIEFRHTFPWASLTRGDPTLLARNPKAHIDEIGEHASLPAALPALLLGGIAGLALCFRRGGKLTELRVPMLGTLAGCAVIFTWGLVTYRYEHDTVPWMVFGSAVAVLWLPSVSTSRIRYGIAGLFVALTLYSIAANMAIAVSQQRRSDQMPPEKRYAFLDLSRMIDTSGLNGFWSYIRHWHRYIGAASFDRGNLFIDRFQFAETETQPIVRSLGTPPFGAEYDVNLPSPGKYEISVRYAAARPLPVHLLLNGRDVKEICTKSTGGWAPVNQAWDSAGLFQLPGGAATVGLAANSSFPPVSLIRITKVD